MDRKQLQTAKGKTAIDLEKEVHELRDRLWNLRKDLAVGKVKNVREIRLVRKTIAQLLTIIEEKSAVRNP